MREIAQIERVADGDEADDQQPLHLVGREPERDLFHRANMVGNRSGTTGGSAARARICVVRTTRCREVVNNLAHNESFIGMLLYGRRDDMVLTSRFHSLDRLGASGFLAGSSLPPASWRERACVAQASRGGSSPCSERRWPSNTVVSQTRWLSTSTAQIFAAAAASLQGARDQPKLQALSATALADHDDRLQRRQLRIRPRLQEPAPQHAQSADGIGAAEIDAEFGSPQAEFGQGFDRLPAPDRPTP